MFGVWLDFKLILKKKIWKTTKNNLIFLKKKLNTLEIIKNTLMICVSYFR